MKKIKLISLVILIALFLCSCAVSFRNAGEDISSLPTGTTDAQTEPVVNMTVDSYVTEAILPTDEVQTDPDTEADTTIPAVTEPEEQSEETTEPEITPVDPPMGNYKPKALMYHLILEEVYGPYDNLFVRPAEFDTHLTVLDELGYEYLFAEEWRITEKPSVIITLDDGYEDNYTEMFPILKAHGAKATVFLVTDLIGTDGYMTREMIHEMSESGLVSFQCHTAHHSDLSYQTAEGLRADFDESCGIIEEITGKSVRALAYPAGSYNDTVLSVADEYFDFAYTTKSPTSTPEYTDLTVPRYYIARGYGRDMFKGFVNY